MLWTTFDVGGVPGSRSVQPQVECKQYSESWTFTVTPCRFETKVTVFVTYSDPSELLFQMEYNNAGVKLFKDEKVFKIPGFLDPSDLKIEGYRAKTITVKRPPANDDTFFV